jgi:murein DD-endopeptidase MepM/ murein hydrolase activator NlpD
MNNENVTPNVRVTRHGLKYLFKKYRHYIVLVGLILILVAAITLTSILASNIPTDVSTGVIEFVSPILNGTVLKSYKSDELQFNEALNQWEIHLAVDFDAPAGTNVLACYDGTIDKVYTNTLKGTVIEIKHNDSLTTVYSGLDGDVFVEVGDEVNKGDVIGTSSSTANRETDDGGQIHFEVWKDGALVDPAGYLDLSPK